MSGYQRHGLETAFLRDVDRGHAVEVLMVESLSGEIPCEGVVEIVVAVVRAARCAGSGRSC